MRNLEEVKTAIEQWFITLGYTEPERAEKQYLKIIAEVGEMADALCKEDIENFKSEAGDVFVTIVGYCLQINRELTIQTGSNSISDVFQLNQILKNLYFDDYNTAIHYLSKICWLQNTTLLECATIAYNKIEKRRVNGGLKIINGTIQK